MRAFFQVNSIFVLVNGSPTKEFIASRGLRQGDPLVPFLFHIVAEGLADLIRRAEEENCFWGFAFDDRFLVSLLQFADDTVMLCDGEESNLWSIKEELRIFELASGLKINFATSNVVGVNIEERILQGASMYLACSIGLIPFKFLSIPVGANLRKIFTWKPVLEALKLKLSLWRSTKLSIGELGEGYL